MRKYSEHELTKFIKLAVTETLDGIEEWIKDETHIVDKTTREVLDNAEIDLIPERNGALEKYIYPRLAKHGIIFTKNQLANETKH